MRTRRLLPCLRLGEPLADSLDVGAKRGDRCGVRVRPCSNGDIHGAAAAKRAQQIDADELAKAALEPVSIDGSLAVSRHDDAYARMRQRGSEDSDIEMHGPNSLPLSYDRLQIGSPGQPFATWERKAFATRRRTCSAA